MNSAGDSFAWPFEFQGWFGKTVVQGLIAIIPVVGWIALSGWLMLTIENYRAGWRGITAGAVTWYEGVIGRQTALPSSAPF